MLIEDAIKSAEATRATVEAQEFRGYKFAKVSTLTVKHLCKWVINMGQQVIAMRQKVFDLETELEESAARAGREPYHVDDGRACRPATADGEVR